MTPELYRPVRVDEIGPIGLAYDVEANVEECVALAQRMQIPEIRALTCTFRLAPEFGGAFAALGRLRATVVRTCVVSLDDFPVEIDEQFAIRFVPAGQETENPDPEVEDEVSYQDGVLDLGEATAEQLALSLEPYPRRPDAELPQLGEDKTENPFAVLRRLH